MRDERGLKCVEDSGVEWSVEWSVKWKGEITMRDRRINLRGAIQVLSSPLGLPPISSVFNFRKWGFFFGRIIWALFMIQVFWFDLGFLVRSSFV